MRRLKLQGGYRWDGQYPCVDSKTTEDVDNGTKSRDGKCIQHVRVMSPYFLSPSRIIFLINTIWPKW
jgi:hypothetical protein